MSRSIPDSTNNLLLGSQYYKCKNKPGSNLKGLENYSCPLWKIDGENRGSFDEAGYEIDHIEEFSISKNNNIKNLQALCLPCHNVKTKNFYANKSNDKYEIDI